MHALDAATPLLDQAERVKDPTDDAVAQLGDPARQILDGQSERQQPGVLDFQAIIADVRPFLEHSQEAVLLTKENLVMLLEEQ